MVYQVDAIYELGVFRPLGPLELPDQSRVTITVASADSPATGARSDDEEVLARVARQRVAARELSEQLAHIPDRSPDDGFSSADHDQILYGRPA
jgi:predicted DNA-binding antitoxin AbrB/MazE fold protein